MGQTRGQTSHRWEAAYFLRPHRGKKASGFAELPDHLPIKEVIIKPEEYTTGMKSIGEEITDAIEYTPASLIGKRTIRPKNAKLEGEVSW